MSRDIINKLSLSLLILVLFAATSHQQFSYNKWSFELPPYYYYDVMRQPPQDDPYRILPIRSHYRTHKLNHPIYTSVEENYFYNNPYPPLLIIDEKRATNFYSAINAQPVLSEFGRNNRPSSDSSASESASGPLDDYFDDYAQSRSDAFNDDETESRLLWDKTYNYNNNHNMNNNQQNNYNNGGLMSTIAGTLLNKKAAIVGPSGTCIGYNGEPGVCLLPSVCNLYGMQSSGICGIGATSCCINVVSKCNQIITVNNTIWQQPYNLSGISNCELTVRLVEIEKPEKVIPICQVRLDFHKFTIEQPDDETVCRKDAFSVRGSMNDPSDICGDNEDQHMYLHIPPYAFHTVDLKLAFALSPKSDISRFWNIQIALLPCWSNYLAPDNCLKYFTSSTGTIKSYNWKENQHLKRDHKKHLPTRQLANQREQICIRSQSATMKAICYQTCSETSFIISTNHHGNLNQNQKNYGDCNNDYVFIPAGFNPHKQYASSSNPNFADRYCGERLSSEAPDRRGSTSGVSNQMVCTGTKPFHLYYQTNGDETETDQRDLHFRGNQGFCLKFMQIASNTNTNNFYY